MSTLQNDTMGKTSDAQIKAVMKYNKANVVKCYLDLNRNTDADIIEYLEKVGNKQGTIKQAIREHMNKGSE